MMCVNGLAAANQVLIPVLAGEYSHKALQEMHSTIKKVVTNLGAATW